MANAGPKANAKSLAPRTNTFFRSCLQSVQMGRQWMFGSSNSVLSEAVPFQGPIDEIIEEQPARLIRPAFYGVIGLFLAVVVVASVTRVEIVVTGTGHLATNMPPIVLQPMDRAIIRELKVRTGDPVKKGQVLAVLDSTFTQADLAMLAEQKRALQEKVRGLEAELKSIASAANAAPFADDGLQNGLYRQRIVQYRSRIHVYDEGITQLRAGIQTTEDDISALDKQLAVTKDLEQMRGSLSQLQVGSKMQYLDAQTYRMRAEQEYRNAVNHLAELRQDVIAKQAERQLFIDEWRRQTLEDLITARTGLSTVSENLVKASRMNDLVVLTAPDDGIVLEMTKLSVGSVLGAADHLVTIIPNSATLVADISISARDIGYVKAGDEVTVKVDAFPFQRHGKLSGRLLWVNEVPAAEASSGKTGGASHRGWVEFLDTTMKDLPEGARLIPGMTLSADIKVGSRSIMAYLLYPVTRAFNDNSVRP